MSAEEETVVNVITKELDEAEFTAFIIDFIGPMAQHLPDAFRETFRRLTGLEEFPSYRTFLVTAQDSPNRAFYLSLTPETMTGYDLEIDTNFYKGNVSPDAMGLILTLYVVNGMLWSGALPERTARYLHNAFYLLRDLAAEHPEAADIYGAID